MTQMGLTDVREIRDLAYRYAQAVDRGDGEAYANLFLDDAVLEGSGYHSQGRSQLLKIPGFTSSRYLKTFHAVYNHLITVDGEAASGEVYCQAHHLSEVEGGLSDMVMFIRYQDDYARTPQGWRFARRELVVDWAETRPAEPHRWPKL
jgi:uncharacterized protein (TIGR02246 family)